MTTSVSHTTIDSLLTAHELRTKIFAEKQELVQSRQQKLESLKNAHDKLVELLVDFIYDQAKTTLEKNPFKKSFRLFNPLDRIQIDGYKWLYLLYGSYNKNSRTYNRNFHENAGINFTPVEEANRILYSKGFSVEDISDPAKSFNTVLLVRMLD